jgi:hypothetical protein
LGREASVYAEIETFDPNFSRALQLVNSGSDSSGRLKPVRDGR